MPCLQAITAVLAAGGIIEHMAITEASVRAAIESFVEPCSQQPLAQAGALRKLEIARAIAARCN